MADAKIEIGISNTIDKARFKAFAKELKLVDKKLRLAFNRRIRAILEPLKEEVKSSASESLPRSGGFAADIAASRFTTGINQSGVVFKMKDQYSLKKIDEGRLRHPVFGRMKDPWVMQPIHNHFWTKPVDEAKPEIQAAIIEAVEEVAKEIEAI